jgi:hypothetical protein
VFCFVWSTVGGSTVVHICIAVVYLCFSKLFYHCFYANALVCLLLQLRMVGALPMVLQYAGVCVCVCVVYSFSIIAMFYFYVVVNAIVF